jgi:hypothetical protein
MGITPILALVLAIGFGLVWAEQAGRLPSWAGKLVRQAEFVVLVPILDELGIEMPEGLRRHQPEIPSAAPGDEVDLAEARALLEQIRVEPERRRGYARNEWPHWLDLDGDCMDARQEVLQAESLEPARVSADGCKVIGGRWLDRFTGETVRDPSMLDVDHFVPLAEAHDSGGHAWNRERRAAFANDLSDPRSLIAVTAAANRSKSDQGPEDWLPPLESYRCQYVAGWIAVKARWMLAMDERERVTVGNMLEACAVSSEPSG